MRLMGADEYMRTWSPRIGSEAAALRLRGSQFQGLACLCSAAGALLLVIGGKLDIAGVWIPGIVIFVGVVPSWWLMHRRRVESRKVASRTLGMELGRRNYPPRWDAAYLNWCKRHDVTPFAADRPANETASPSEPTGALEPGQEA